MNNIKINKLFYSVKSAIKKHSPEILTGMGIAGMITTVVMAVRATPKALSMLDEKRNEKEDKLTFAETVKTAWTCYIPPMIMGTVSIICLISAASVSTRRHAALATAYTLSETAMREYQEKVIETVGEKKEQAVYDAIAKDKIKNDPVSEHEIIITTKGDTLCYDAISGRYFKSDINKLKKAENDLNRQMRSEMFISLNEFYSEIGLSEIPIGDYLCWRIDKAYIDLEFSSQLDENGTPCLVLRYRTAPEYYPN